MKPWIASHQLLTALGLDPTTVRLFEWRDWTGSTYTTSTARSHALIGYKIDGGRNDARSRTTPLTCTVELLRDWTTAPDIGDRFRLTLADAAATELGLTTDQAVRFTGYVTDVLELPGTNLIQVAAAGRMTTRLATEVFVSFGEDLDGDRAAEVLTGAGYTTGEYVAAGGTFRIPGVMDLVNAQAYLDALADSTLAQAVEERTGQVRWATLEQRGAAPLAATLDGSDLLNSFQWRRAVGDIINAATATSTRYGQHTALDPISVTDLDGVTYLTNISTLHRHPYSALKLAWTVVGLFGRQRHRLPTLRVDLTRTVSALEAAALVKLTHGDRINLTGLPPGPYTSTDAYVEGWSEEARPRSWRLELHVSDPYISADALDIADAPVGLTFAEVTPGLTFLDAAHVTTPGGLTA